MAFRSVFKGSLSFGLVNVPVKAMKATDSHDIGFGQRHSGCGGQVGQLRVCKCCDQTVEYRDIVSGTEVDGKLVIVTEEEKKALQDEAGSAIEVLHFVNAGDIDPIMYDGSNYYLEADNSDEGYALLRTVLSESNRVGVVRWTARGKTHMGVLRVVGAALVIHQLLWADEIRDQHELKSKPVTLKPQLVEMAHKLVESMTTDSLDLGEYRDSYQDRLGELVAAKSQGVELTLVKNEAPAEDVSDLLAALEASIKTA